MCAQVANAELSDVIAGIYDCVIEPERWGEALNRIRILVNAAIAQLGLLDVQRNRALFQMTVGEMREEWIRRQAGHIEEINAFTVRQLDNGLSLDEPMIVSRTASKEELATSPYWQNLVRHQGFCDIGQINIVRTPTRISVLGMGRYERFGAFTSEEIELMRLLVPHMRRAMMISNIIDVKSIENARLSDTLDKLDVGVIIADEDANILHSNKPAADLLSSGELLRDDRGALQARGKAEVEIKSAIRIAARNESDLGSVGLAIPLSSDRDEPALAHVLPLNGGPIRSRLAPFPAAAIFVSTSHDEAKCVHSLTRAFKLTPKESVVLSQMLSGRNVIEAARSLELSPTTVRSHLNSIFSKTGTRRQSELVSLAMRTAPIR